MGMLLSEHGIGPLEEKVQAAKEATLPTSASEVRRFLVWLDLVPDLLQILHNQGRALKSYLSERREMCLGYPVTSPHVHFAPSHFAPTQSHFARNRNHFAPHKSDFALYKLLRSMLEISEILPWTFCLMLELDWF